METTPRAGLRTPGRRAISAEPPSSRRSVHTPLERNTTRDLLSSIRRRTPASGRRNNAPTPHAKAARRALDQRRTAMFTPGKNRRRSQVMNRESPGRILGQLASILAPKSKPIVYSSSSPRDTPSSSRLPIFGDDDDDDQPIEPPNITIPIDSEDDDSDLRPPRLSLGDDENFTVQSIELPRRVASEQPESRLSRGSFGSERLSEIFADGDDDIEEQDSEFFPGLMQGILDRALANDEDYERLDADQTQQLNLRRESEFGLQMPVDLDEPTFVMSEPGAELPPTSPLLDDPMVGASDSDGNEPFAPLPAYSDGDMTDEDLDGEINTGVQDMDAEISMPTARASAKTKQPAKKQKRISQHGIEYPPLPSAFVKRVAQTALQTSGLSNHRISPDTLTALTQASEWFFEQLGDDLGAYASHAKRKTIEESDVVTLMRRQRQIGSNATMFSLAQRHLPRELLQELRMPVPQPVKTRRAKKARVDDTEEEAEVT